jgi:uncharacterized protein YjiS (DUF1127 family)
MTMILTSHTELDEGALHPTIRTVALAFVRWRAQRSRRLALQSLLELEPYRLDDLGLSVEAVREALAR